MAINWAVVRQMDRKPVQYRVVHEPSGRELTSTIPTRPATRRTIRELMRMGYVFNDLAVLDMETGRYISWVQF